MSEEYSRKLMKVSVAKMLQTIGWNSIHTTPLEILTDISVQYVTQLAKSTHDYSNEFGCSDPNLDHLGLAFRDLHINLTELEEYVTFVNFGQSPTPVPQYPIPKEDNLNFLKPGSKEVVTRPVHIHEHLPPMHTINEATDNDMEVPMKVEENISDDLTETNAQIFKKPAEISPNETFKRPRLLMEEEGRPTREISSVMMTTSGYISPAREGKLPESRTPVPSIETVTNTNSTTGGNSGNAMKPNKVFKKQEKKKEKVGKELFKPIPEDKVKKITTMKDVVKLKQMKAVHANNVNGQPPQSNNFVVNNEVKIPPPHQLGSANKPSTPKINKALAAARLKTEKLNTTITPIPVKQAALPEVSIVDKLFTEPDKKKVNILKKISNVKNEKLENKIVKIKEDVKQESRESSPDLIIDETHEANNSKLHISNDITIELIDAAPQKVDKSEKNYFDDDSPPGTPSTPKTPEMISQSPPVNKEKRKRKDKTKIKKVHKIPSPTRMDYETTGFIDVERPKTPEAHVLMHHHQPPLIPSPNIPFALFPQFTGPGLIPSPLTNPLFSNMNLPNLPLFGLGTNPCLPSDYTGLPLNFMPPMKHEEPRSKSPVVHKPPPPTYVPTAPETPEIIPSPKPEKKTKEHKKEKKDKIKKKNKKDKLKNKAEKKKLKEEKKDKEKIKKEKREKRKEKELQMRESLEIAIPKLTLKLGTPSPRPDTPDTKKLNIKPVVKKDAEEVEKPKEPEVERELSPELAKISALVTGQPKPKSVPVPVPPAQKEDIKEDSAAVPAQRTHPGPGRPRIHPIKQKTLKPNKRQVPVKDSEGNEVWICPACQRQDDGSPMIGCDDCDAWYHWVCVGIQVPPDDNEDWYCRLCIVKKQEVLQSDKKKKRKKREKKEH